MDATLTERVVGRMLEGRYLVNAALASGGMGSVYVGTDERLHRKVAIKVMHPWLAADPQLVARFEREAQAAAGLELHPNIVGVYDQGRDGDSVFLVMEYVPGSTLRQVLRDRGRLPVAEAITVVDHVAAALAAAHRAGLVHRDVKPENVLVTADGRIKVVDFGLARAIDDSTVTGADQQLLGTATYIAPEQVAGAAADARSDVYAAGILLFELLTGTTPFRGPGALAVAHQRLTDDVPAPSAVARDVPALLDTVVRDATAREPAARYADGAALRAALDDVRDRLALPTVVPTPSVDLTGRITPTTAGGGDSGTPGAVSSPTAALPPAAAAGRRRRRWPFVVLAVLLLAAAAGVTGWWFAAGRYVGAPNVVGLPRTQATAALEHAGLHWRWTASVYSDRYAAGVVVVEAPRGGSRIERGGTVTLTASKGPQQRAMPDVRGLTADAATAALRTAGFTGDTPLRERYSLAQPKGHVLATKPRTGKVVDVTAPVTLIVSSGARPVDVPDVQGKSVADATAVLRAAGLVVSATPTSVYSDTVPSGAVVRTTPASGAHVHEGVTVRLIVSKGPHLYDVPLVEQMPIARAVVILRRAGFVPEPHEIFPFGPGKVVRETPKDPQPRGATIRLDYF